MFFMALVARLVNDPSVACRVMHEQALKTLLQVQFRGCSSCLAHTMSCSLSACSAFEADMVQPRLCKGYIDPM